MLLKLLSRISFRGDTGLMKLLQQAGAPDDKPTRRGNVLWRSFWGAHQRFFRHLCMAAKVPGLVRMSNVSAEVDVVLLLLHRCLITFLKCACICLVLLDCTRTESSTCCAYTPCQTG